MNAATSRVVRQRDTLLEYGASNSIVRGVEYQRADDASTAELIRAAEKDMFR